MPVELIGPVDQPGGNGPSNGMYALQKELRKRIDEGLDWLSIKSLPVSEGAMPWFWNWNDRRYALWWDAEGLPFVQGPNMLFTNSASASFRCLLAPEYRFSKSLFVCSEFCLIKDFSAYIHGMTEENMISTESGEQFTRLLLQNQKRFWGLILSLVPNGSDADDVLQETCAVMWRKYSEFEPGTDFAAWGLRIARFQVMRYYSRRKSERARLSDDVIEAVAIQFAAPNQDKKSTDRSAALKGCLAKLKSVQFDTLHRRYDEGQPVEEIAEEMNVSIHAIYKRLDRTYQQLHNCITNTLSQQERLA